MITGYCPRADASGVDVADDEPLVDATVFGVL
jgi:hypothetical protein